MSKSYKKIYIVGAPGSGKTFISNKLSQLMGLNVYGLDDIFWDRSRTDAYVRANEKTRDAKLAKVLEQDNWIIEGVYYKWLKSAFRDSDIIIVLNPSVYLRQWRIFKRFLHRKFILGEFKKESLSSFIEMALWNQKFDSDNMIRIQNFIAEHQDKVVFCKDHSDVVKLLVQS